ncbi:hypothetical protein RHSIM_RhsimUnG0162800 [Rhododendron simsii]|uniref:Uncharacterized protein n=1 Tax=Rhododendron simsii TaxID=118357 RepID=A0A834FUC2_RHOSS|nr:hypothetical protein RHSIM_RhsimUnG0162800 [Rhododendron simsii]
MRTRGGGSVTQLQLPAAKRIQNPKHRQSLKNPSSERKTSIRCKLSESKYPSEEPEDEHVEGSFRKSDVWKQLNGLYKFSRPYVVMNTALVPSMMMNLYAVGLNQLTDVEIDKVNKPYLPLVSGEISTEFGIAITSTYLLTSFAMGVMFQSPPLLSALLARFLLMTAYSVQLPLLRWKRNAFLAIDSQGNGQRSYLHTHSVAFMSLFSTVIALSKDIEDVDGDREHGIQSLAQWQSSLERKSFFFFWLVWKVFWLCISMLLIGYGCAMVIGASSSSQPASLSPASLKGLRSIGLTPLCFVCVNQNHRVSNNVSYIWLLLFLLFQVLGHCVLASTLWLRARSVDLDNKASISSFYMLIWQASD